MTAAGHPAERLSAYADDELPPDERAAVEAHLRECAACREELEDLVAVDEAARDLPVQAPPGYFDAFPGRVTARLAARRRRALPAWTWAAAAAVLLAVLTPLTLRQRAGDAALKDSAPAPVTTDGGVPAGPAQAPERPAPSLPQAPEAREGKESGFVPATERPARRRDHPVLSKREPPARLAARDAAVDELPRAQRPAPAKTVPAEAPASAETAAAGAAERDSMAGAEAPPPVARQRPRRPASTPAERESASPSAGTILPSATPSPGPSTAGTLSEGASHLKAAQLMNRAESLAALAARPQATAAQIRDVAAAYRSYARQHAGTDESDEARVRAIEALAAAWRLDRRAEDRALARTEAADYLSGAAPRKARVLAALAQLAR